MAEATRAQHFIEDGKTEEFLEYLEKEGFTFPLGRQTLLERPYYLCIDLGHMWVSLVPNGAACGAIARDGLLETAEDFRSVWEAVKAGKGRA